MAIVKFCIHRCRLKRRLKRSELFVIVGVGPDRTHLLPRLSTAFKLEFIVQLHGLPGHDVIGALVHALSQCGWTDGRQVERELVCLAS